MSDEKPTCKHGNIMQHEILPKHFTSSAYWCSGPVIATEPLCDVDFCRRYRIDVNCIDGVYCKCVCHGVSTEPETPESADTAFEMMLRKIRGAMVESDIEFEKSGGSTSDYLRLFMRELSRRGLAILPVSDPIPELRERVACLEDELAEASATIKLVYDYDSNLIDALERRA